MVIKTCFAMVTCMIEAGYLDNSISLCSVEVPADPRRISTETTLTFTNMSTKDAMVIQCNVTNKYGYNFTNAYLNVLGNEIFNFNMHVHLICAARKHLGSGFQGGSFC